jgi:hypothetical protein
MAKLSKIYSLEELQKMFLDKPMYDNKIVGDKIENVPTSHCLKLMLISNKQNGVCKDGEIIMEWFKLKL